MKQDRADHGRSGFTLLELSIVLIIIGLLVGAILVGAEMIRASQIRAGISQLEQYNSAVNLFRNRYHALPGDIRATATDNPFDFDVRDPTNSVGDVDGQIEGYAAENRGCGEDMLFWRDLARANLIEESYLGYTYNPLVCGPDVTTQLELQQIFPKSKAIDRAFVMVYTDAGLHYFELNGITQTNSGYSDILGANGQIANALAAEVAYAFDQKIDDSLALSGTVRATNAVGGKVNALATAQAPSLTVCVSNAVVPVNYHMVNTELIANCGVRIRTSF